MKQLNHLWIIILSALLIGACSNTTSVENSSAAEALAVESGLITLSEEALATLNSLQQVDDHPLYVMHYYTTYGDTAISHPNLLKQPAWGCSLFAALGDADNMIYGRNFDWQYSPALLLFTNPSDGYASIAMVDIEYLGFDQNNVGNLLDLSLTERTDLLDAPLIPFDGMNEHGLAIGMAAVPDSKMPDSTDKETIGSLGIIRKILDHARTVEEAIAIMEDYTIQFRGGPPLHYLIADATGQSVLVEFFEGEMVVIPNEEPWHIATNFLRSAAGDHPEAQCTRYETISNTLPQHQGQTTSQEAFDLLANVAQHNTQWSVVYQMTSGQVQVVMDQQYDQIHTFQLDMVKN